MEFCVVKVQLTPSPRTSRCWLLLEMCRNHFQSSQSLMISNTRGRKHHHTLLKGTTASTPQPRKGRTPRRLASVYLKDQQKTPLATYRSLARKGWVESCKPPTTMIIRKRFNTYWHPGSIYSTKGCKCRKSKNKKQNIYWISERLSTSRLPPRRLYHGRGEAILIRETVPETWHNLIYTERPIGKNILVPCNGQSKQLNRMIFNPLFAPFHNPSTSSFLVDLTMTIHAHLLYFKYILTELRVSNESFCT